MCAYVITLCNTEITIVKKYCNLSQKTANANINGNVTPNMRAEFRKSY